ncbi:MAG TPA: hypothetical protein VNA28_09070, partial [Solirubrobacteraceae bacterium]|nr:hypothetical protein [Solirubrobacteraceae bacterium]
AKSVSESANIITRSRRGTKRTDSVTITNRAGRARSFYVVIPVGTDAAGSLNASYNLQLQRIRFRR